MSFHSTLYHSSYYNYSLISCFFPSQLRPDPGVRRPARQGQRRILPPELVLPGDPGLPRRRQPRDLPQGHPQAGIQVREGNQVRLRKEEVMRVLQQLRRVTCIFSWSVLFLCRSKYIWRFDDSICSCLDQSVFQSFFKLTTSCPLTVSLHPLLFPRPGRRDDLLPRLLVLAAPDDDGVLRLPPDPKRRLPTAALHRLLGGGGGHRHGAGHRHNAGRNLRGREAVKKPIATVFETKDSFIYY